MDVLAVIAVVAVLVYALGRKTSSAHGKLAASQKELEQVAASLRDRTAEVGLLRAKQEEHEAEVGGVREDLAAAEALLAQTAAARNANAERAESLAAELSEASEARDTAQASLAESEAERDGLTDRVVELEKLVGRAAELGPEAREVGEAFVAWCHRPTALVGRSYLFERALRAAHPGATVTPVYRAESDAVADIGGDGAAPLPRFRHGGMGAEHWLVQLGAEQLLLPHPRSPDAFGELAPAFDGAGAPRTVSAVAPARLGAAADGLVLEAPGEVA